ncbi:MAG: FkbM family methyltransferase [Patescibacteria group bacterium]|nr:FkbM family methyltransferase [Patescibacteria group bacterium]MDE1988288.1 FkbM family methyltransferase [Patescibacteria group bacterium]MDE2218062.1 FkbM family methyltransferase [Patescibacteria group bacterium]
MKNKNGTKSISTRSSLRWFLSKFLSILPSGSPKFIYATALKPKILKNAANKILKIIMPKETEIEDGVFLELDQSDPVASGAIALGVYEKYESDIFRSKIKQGMTIIDIGANLGYYAAIAARRAGERGLVIAFEPEPNFFKLLSKNISRNNLKNASLFEMAIADKNGKMELFLSNENKGNNSLIQSENLKTSVRVKSVTLDDFITSRKIEKVDIVKMDIEGAEILAIEGMKKTLIKHKPLLFLEFSPHSIVKLNRNPTDFISILSGMGYSIFEINETRKSLNNVTDFQKFVERIPKGKYADLYCESRSK